MKRGKWITVSLVLFMVLESMAGFVIASTKEELNNESKNIDSKIESTKTEIGEVELELSDELDEIQNLTIEINDYQDQIDTLEEEISIKQDEIDEKEKEIEKFQKNLDDKQEMLDKRLVALYESGQTSYIDLLLSSDDLTDFISKYYLIEELATYDTNLINEIASLKSDVEVSKTEIEDDKAELEVSKNTLEDKKIALDSLKTEKEEKVANLSDEEKQLESELTELEKDKKEVQKKIEELAKKESQASLGSASQYGYIFPVKGASKANISNKNFPSYTGHTGVDINIGVSGKEVVAVKDGTVVTSEAKIRNGSYYSYGEYIIINHHDGTMTLYAHMQAGSRRVSVGDTVKQGQTIGIVGSTGNSTGPHLHFEVWLNGKVVNPLPYLP